jgi:hypothetical protein
MTAAEAQVAIRLPDTLIERADGLISGVGALPEYQLWRISRSAVLRLAIQKGLDVLEREVARASKAGE